MKTFVVLIITRIFNVDNGGKIMLDNATIEKMRTLRLTGMLNTWQQIQDSEKYAQLTLAEGLGLLIDGEYIYRHNKKQRRILNNAKLRFRDACVEDINYQHNRRLSRDIIKLIISCQWITKVENIILLGPTGIGKTYLACAFARQASRLNYSIKYFRLSKLIEQIKISHGNGSYSKLLSQLLKFNVLIIDDWGIEPLDGSICNTLLEIIDDRYGIGSVIMVSQLPVNLWHNYINNNTVADAILDRLINKAIKVALEGDSLRK